MSLTKVTYSMIDGAPINVRDYGAIGDGVTDNTAAIQAAIDALPEGGTLYIPTASNHYLFTTLNIAKSLTICGEGYFSLVNAAFGDSGYLSASMVKGSVLRSTQTTGYAFNVNNATFNNILNFNNLAIVGPGSGTSIGIYTPTNNPAISLDVSNILIANFYTGLSITSAFESVFVRLGVFGCTTGFFVPYDSVDYFSDNHFYACQFQWCAKGLHLDSGSGINIENSVFQACTNIAIELTPQSNGRVETVHINKCWLENSGAGVKSVSLNVTNGSMKFLTFCDNRMGAGDLEFKRDTGSFTLNYLSFERNYFGASTTTIPTWVENCQVNTTEFLSLTNNSQSFTPTWSADSVNPAIGNGSLTGLYQTNAGVVTLTIKVTMGSTTTFGTGAWFFGGLPFVPNQDTVGSVLMYDDTTNNYYSGTCLLGPSVSTVARVQANGTGRISSSVPFTWAANDYLLLNITFPV